jgi:hypothetical protein
MKVAMLTLNGTQRSKAMDGDPETDVGEEWEAPYGEQPDIRPDAFTPVETSDEAS